MSIVDSGYDEDVPASRHGRYAEGTRKFQVTVRASVPGEMELWRVAESAAEEDGVTMVTVPCGRWPWPVAVPETDRTVRMRRRGDTAPCPVGKRSRQGGGATVALFRRARRPSVATYSVVGCVTDDGSTFVAAAIMVGDVRTRLVENEPRAGSVLYVVDNATSPAHAEEEALTDYERRTSAKIWEQGEVRYV